MRDCLERPLNFWASHKTRGGTRPRGPSRRVPSVFKESQVLTPLRRPKNTMVADTKFCGLRWASVLGRVRGSAIKMAISATVQMGSVGPTPPNPNDFKFAFEKWKCFCRSSKTVSMRGVDPLMFHMNKSGPQPNKNYCLYCISRPPEAAQPNKGKPQTNRKVRITKAIKRLLGQMGVQMAI